MVDMRGWVAVVTGGGGSLGGLAASAMAAAGAAVRAARLARRLIGAKCIGNSPCVWNQVREATA